MPSVILPNGENQFTDEDGKPFAAGSVAFYIPSTLTFKDTWQDEGETILNTNPIALDAAGRAIIWGTGLYRQILKDSLGNTIWDQVTGIDDTANATAVPLYAANFGVVAANNDNRTQLQACFDAALALGGCEIILPNGTLKISGAVTMNGACSLTGQGVDSTIIQTTTASRALLIPTLGTGNGNGILKNFTIDLNSIGTDGICIGSSALQTCINVAVRNGTGGNHNWVFCATQNAVFINCVSGEGDTSVLFTSGVGNLMFIRCEFASANVQYWLSKHVASYEALLGVPGGSVTQNFHISTHHCIFENGAPTYAMYFTDGDDQGFHEFYGDECDAGGVGGGPMIFVGASSSENSFHRTHFLPSSGATCAIENVGFGTKVVEPLIEGSFATATFLNDTGGTLDVIDPPPFPAITFGGTNVAETVLIQSTIVAGAFCRVVNGLAIAQGGYLANAPGALTDSNIPFGSAGHSFENIWINGGPTPVCLNGGNHTVTSGEAGANLVTIATGFTNGKQPLIDIIRSGERQAGGAPFVSAGSFTLVSGNGYTLTAGDVIVWLVLGP